MYIYDCQNFFSYVNLFDQLASYTDKASCVRDVTRKWRHW